MKLFSSEQIFQKIRQKIIRLWETLANRNDTCSDVVCDLWLVCHPKDFDVAKLAMESVLRFSLNPIQKIFFVSTERVRPAWLSEKVIYICECDIPGIDQVMLRLKGESYQGWIVQQILKFSGAYYSNRFLVVDCDTVLLRPHLFFDHNKTVLRFSYEHSPHYAALEKALDVNGGRWFSYVCHMMPFQSAIVKKLLESIERKSGVSWQVYLADVTKAHGMVLSEWDLYARFLIQEGNPYTYRPWINQSLSCGSDMTLDLLIEEFGCARNSVSLHVSGTNMIIK